MRSLCPCFWTRSHKIASACVLNTGGRERHAGWWPAASRRGAACGGKANGWVPLPSPPRRTTPRPCSPELLSAERRVIQISDRKRHKFMGITVVRDSTLRSHYESVERVITVMRNQIDQPMTLQQMARIGSASPYHFNRTFRQVTGVPPLQFLYALRLDAAKRLPPQAHQNAIDS